jgi:hypothetical protein
MQAKPKAMSGDTWRAWLKRTGMKAYIAAEALGISNNSPSNYKAEGAPRTVALACAAIAAGLDPWSEENAEEYEAVKVILGIVRKQKC